MVLIIVILIFLFNSSFSLEAPYTEDINEFKDKNYNIRTQLLVGCWLYTYEYLSEKGIGPVDENSVHILKNCMKNIKRKQAILKITSLAKENMQPTKDFKSIVDLEILEQISNPSPSQFDIYILGLIQKYEEDFKEMRQKGDIKDQVQEELNKRKVYYLGIIPANTFNTTALLVTVAITILCCCIWRKSYNENLQKKVAIKKTRKEEITELQKKKKELKSLKQIKQQKKKVAKFKGVLEKSKKK